MYRGLKYFINVDISENNRWIALIITLFMRFVIKLKKNRWIKDEFPNKIIRMTV